MASERADELYRALIERRYPKELCSEIAYKYLNTDYTATCMLGYLYRMTEPPAVDVVVDEMIAILSDREQLIKKKESEHAQAVISIYNVKSSTLTPKDDNLAVATLI